MPSNPLPWPRMLPFSCGGLCPILSHHFPPSVHSENQNLGYPYSMCVGHLLQMLAAWPLTAYTSCLSAQRQEKRCVVHSDVINLLGSFVFCFFFFLEWVSPGISSVDQAALTSQRSPCLCLLSSGIRGMHCVGKDQTSTSL